MKMLKSIFSVTIVILASIVTNLANNQFYDTNYSNIGKAVQIVKFIDGKPLYDGESMRRVFQHEKAKGKPAIIISIAGDQGKGKSFLLNYFLRYLNYTQYNGDKSPPVSIEQLFENNGELSGFEWGNKADGGTTMGILIWSYPFILNLEDNTKVAVFLMDTQGSHDGNLNTINNALVYSLSTLVSSIQIYNIANKAKGYDYKHLVQFSNHGATVAERQNYSVKPFQKLIFLVRDWSTPSSFPYGLSGGERYKNEVLLAINDKNTEEIKENKLRIKDCYASISCFLMPHPGIDVAVARNSRDFNLHSLPKEFSQELINFMKWIFGTEIINSANIKKVNGMTIFAESVPIFSYNYFKYLLKVNGNFESIDDFNNANIRAYNHAVLQDAYSYYAKEMDSMLGFMTTWDERKLQQLHNEYYKGAIELFRKTPKPGDKATQTYYENLLKESITAWYTHAKETKDVKKARDLAILGLSLVMGGVAGAALVGNPSAVLPLLKAVLMKIIAKV